MDRHVILDMKRRALIENEQQEEIPTMDEHDTGVPGDLMTVGGARELLGVSKTTMARLIREGTLPTQPDPIDRRIRLIRRADLVSLMSRSSKRAA
jgi:excisionase family DNA binding protein